MRSRPKLVRTLFGGKPCGEMSQERECSDGPCPVHCEVTQWSSWRTCTHTCGGGKRVRYRDITTHANHDGYVCPACTNSRRATRIVVPSTAAPAPGARTAHAQRRAAVVSALGSALLSSSRASVARDAPSCLKRAIARAIRTVPCIAHGVPGARGKHAPRPATPARRNVCVPSSRVRCTVDSHVRARTLRAGRATWSTAPCTAVSAAGASGVHAARLVAAASRLTIARSRSTRRMAGTRAHHCRSRANATCSYAPSTACRARGARGKISRVGAGSLLAPARLCRQQAMAAAAVRH